MSFGFLLIFITSDIVGKEALATQRVLGTCYGHYIYSVMVLCCFLRWLYVTLAPLELYIDKASLESIEC